MKSIRYKFVKTLLTDLGKVINYSVMFPVPKDAVDCPEVTTIIMHPELLTAFTIVLPIKATLIKGKYYYCETSEDFDKLMRNVNIIQMRVNYFKTRKYQEKTFHNFDKHIGGAL